MKTRALSQTQEALEVRRIARMRLAALGYTEGAIRGTPRLIAAIEKESGQQAGDDPQGLLERWVAATNPEPAKARLAQPYKGEIAPPRNHNHMQAKPYKPSAQWQINVERARKAQPRLWTPNGIGNGAEGQHGFGRGT